MNPILLILIILYLVIVLSKMYYQIKKYHKNYR